LVWEVLGGGSVTAWHHCRMLSNKTKDAELLTIRHPYEVRIS